MGFLSGTRTCSLSSDLFICRLGKFFTTSDQGRVCCFVLGFFFLFFFGVSACSPFTALLLGYDAMPLSEAPFRAFQIGCQVCVFLNKQQKQTSPGMWLLGAKATFAHKRRVDARPK